MYEPHDDTVKLRSAWRAAERATAAGQWWHAHEHFELVWRGGIDPHAAQSVRALIQVCAALHKPRQATEARAERHDLRAGMSRLLDRARRGYAGGPAEVATWLEAALAVGRAQVAAWGTSPPEPAHGIVLRVSDAALASWWAIERER